MKKYYSCLGLLLLLASSVQAQRTPQSPNKKQADPELDKRMEWILKDVEAGWNTFSVSDTFMYKYHPESVKWISQTIVSVPVRGYVSFAVTKGRERAIVKRKRLTVTIEGYSRFFMFASQYSINCASQEVWFTNWTDYDIDKKILGVLPDSWELTPQGKLQPTRIVLDSVEENLFNVLCRNYYSPTERNQKKALLGY